MCVSFSLICYLPTRFACRGIKDAPWMVPPTIKKENERTCSSWLVLLKSLILAEGVLPKSLIFAGGRRGFVLRSGRRGGCGNGFTSETRQTKQFKFFGDVNFYLWNTGPETGMVTPPPHPPTPKNHLEVFRQACFT